MSEIKRDYYKVLELGQSGKGKTYSFVNMNRDTTGFLNIENKPLPFKGTFKYHDRPLKFQDAFATLIEYGKNPEIDAIVVDSQSAYFDMVLKEARLTKKNFDIWNMYNDEIAKFQDMIKRIPKEIFVTGHYELLNIESSWEKRAKVQGKALEGMVEKDYTMVVYADNKLVDKKFQYFFNLAMEGGSAKCPPDIFGEGIYQIPNDSKYILEKIIEFTK